MERHLFLMTKRGSSRAGLVINALVPSPHTTSSFLQIEAVCGTNMNLASAENVLVVLLLALSGTVETQSYYVSRVISGMVSEQKDPSVRLLRNER